MTLRRDLLLRSALFATGTPAQGAEVPRPDPSLIQAEARRWPALVRRTGAQPD